GGNDRRTGRSDRIGARTMHVIQDTTSFLVILLVAAAAPIVAMWATKLAPSVIVPIAVVELVLGAIVGPHAFNWAHLNGTLDLLGTVGLGFLFFFAGYEVDFDAIRGPPLLLGLVGWLMSVVIAYTFAGLLAAAGVVISGILTGSAMSTTAIGTILPVLR